MMRMSEKPCKFNDDELKDWNQIIRIVQYYLDKFDDNFGCFLNNSYPHYCYECNTKILYRNAWIDYRKDNHIPSHKYFVFIESFWNSRCLGYDVKNMNINKMKLAKKVLIHRRWFKNLWKNDLVQFLCCNCYKKEEAIKLRLPYIDLIRI